ncbi:MAG: ABC transporter substrate-binding protein [Leucobacter sp.]
MTTTKTRAAAAIAAIAAMTLLAGCSPSGELAGGSTSEATKGFPMTLENPWGTTTIETKPTKVAVIDAVDLDIALALGVEPILSSRYADNAFEPWTEEKLAADNIDLQTYDSTDGTDYIAIAAADPDVILATSGWTLDDDYEKLAEIAPVVTWGKGQELTDLTWADRTLLAGKALGLEDRAAEVVADVEGAFAAASEAHPKWQGATLTYAVMHPSQISYVTYEGSDVSFFTDLGFVLPEQASKFSDANNAVSIENIDMLDADVLLVGYPFGDEGILTQSALEANALFQQLPAVKEGRYGILGDDVASPLAYPTPLSHPWVLDRMVPQLEAVVK